MTGPGSDKDPDHTIRRERQATLAELFSRAPMKKTFGMELSFDETHRAVFHLPHNPNLEHALNDTHGGVIATLMDNAGWFTAAVEYDTWIATVELTVRLLEPARQEDLRAVGTLLKSAKNIAIASMEVRSATDRLVATGAGTFAVTTTAFTQPPK
jgi:uncharacterized protein (TIGR00369 family)